MFPFECLNYNTSCHIGALVTFRPTECPDRPCVVSYACGRRWGGCRAWDLGPPRHGKGDRGLAEPPVPLLDSLSTGPGCPSIASRRRDANESQSGFVNIRVRQRPPRAIDQDVFSRDTESDRESAVVARSTALP